MTAITDYSIIDITLDYIYDYFRFRITTFIISEPDIAAPA